MATVREQFLRILSQEHNKRDKRNDVPMSEWPRDENGEQQLPSKIAERQAMLQAVNQIRLKANQPITIQEIIKADNLASGHTDYASKFATYCSELALDGKIHPSSFW